MQPLLSLLVGAALAVSLSVAAQERTAGGSLGNEASWTALKSMIGRTDGEVSILRTDVNAIKACAAQRKLWVSGEGCVDAKSAQYESILHCGASGKIYNVNTNACVSTNEPRWHYAMTSDSGYYTGRNAVMCGNAALNLDTCAESQRGQTCYTRRNLVTSCSGGGSDSNSGACNGSTTGSMEFFKCI